MIVSATMEVSHAQSTWTIPIFWLHNAVLIQHAVGSSVCFSMTFTAFRSGTVTVFPPPFIRLTQFSDSLDLPKNVDHGNIIALPYFIKKELNWRQLSTFRQTILNTQQRHTTKVGVYSND